MQVSLLKPSSLASKTMGTPSFLLKSWEFLLLLSYRFLFPACTLNVKVLLMVSPWQYTHLLTWESSLSFSHLGNLLAINYMQAKNIHLYIYFQTPTAYWTFSILMSTRPKTAHPSLKFCSTSFFIFCIKVLEHHHWRRSSLWLNSSGLSELSSQMADLWAFRFVSLLFNFK